MRAGAVRSWWRLRACTTTATSSLTRATWSCLCCNSSACRTTTSTMSRCLNGPSTTGTWRIASARVPPLQRKTRKQDPSATAAWVPTARSRGAVAVAPLARSPFSGLCPASSWRVQRLTRPLPSWTTPLRRKGLQRAPRMWSSRNARPRGCVGGAKELCVWPQGGGPARRWGTNCPSRQRSRAIIRSRGARSTALGLKCQWSKARPCRARIPAGH
mmetsp:Transcript_60702/g.141453  ORF Transcript_60702/g.141453 Transcript_60702/m.141453 type:complete len:215 (+) Transcript_60702:851-1495(+)